MLRTELCDLLGIEHPIVQSGMGGVAGPALVAEVCNAGGLGVLAGTLTAPDDLRSAIHEVRKLTDRPFGVNLLMMRELRGVDAEPSAARALADVHAVLNPIRERLGLPASIEQPPDVPELISAEIDVIVSERVPVFSSGLGDPGPELTERLHAAGARTMVMVTNAVDAGTAVDNGADVIVAQGAEAGGHRSHFAKPARGPLPDIGTLALVPAVVDAVDVPVVAAGGITDGRGLVAALALGAAGVLMGSRFLVTRESVAPDAHKKRLLEESGESTVLTDALSGRYARVVRNSLTDAYARAAPDEVLPFPSQYIANADVFGVAATTGDAEFLPLWAGQAIGQIDDLPWAADVVTDTIREARALLVHELAERVRTD